MRYCILLLLLFGSPLVAQHRLSLPLEIGPNKTFYNYDRPDALKNVNPALAVGVMYGAGLRYEYKDKLFLQWGVKKPSLPMFHWVILPNSTSGHMRSYRRSIYYMQGGFLEKIGRRFLISYAVGAGYMNVHKERHRSDPPWDTVPARWQWPVATYESDSIISPHGLFLTGTASLHYRLKKHQFRLSAEYANGFHELIQREVFYRSPDADGQAVFSTNGSYVAVYFSYDVPLWVRD